MSMCGYSQTTDFTFRSDDNLLCAPASVKFIQTSSGQPKGYLWDFGNGVRSNMPNPTVSFPNAGTFTVRLIAVYDNTTAEQTKRITINRSVNSSFTTDRNYLCQPGTINFTANANPAIVNYEWNFGDESPRVNTTVPATSHQYTGFGEFNVTLTCRNAFGCSVSSSRTIKIRKPTVTGTRSPSSGCVPAVASFTSSADLPPGSTIASYTWNFGDGQVVTSTFNHINHTYRNVGSFSPTLTITTNDGCSNSFTYDSVKFGTPPTNHVAYTVNPVICGSEVAQFVSKATNATSYDWDFGGGNIVTVTDTLIERRFTTLGIKDITVTPKYNDCPGTPIQLQVEIIGVIAKFNYSNTCSDKKTFEFLNRSDGNMSSIIWLMGDQTPNQTTVNVVHRFPESGAFAVKLLIEDNITGCVDSMKRKIYTANPDLINPANSICINSNSLFNINHNYTNPAATFLWNLLGQEIGPNNTDPIRVTADSLGLFDNYVIINNGPQYCKDSIPLGHPILVRGPMLDFTLPESICLNTPLVVNNTSQPYQPADTIRNWYWNFGSASASVNAYQPPPYQFEVHKAYDIKLTAEDILGCKDSLIKRVNVRPMPFLWIIPHRDTLCEGEQAKLIAYTSDNVLWTSTTPGICTTCDTIRVSPTQTNTLYVTSTNQFNCSVRDSAYQKVHNPFTASPAIPDPFLCRGEKTALDAEPKMKKIEWIPNTGLSDPYSYTPIASPENSTIYKAILTDSAGCFSSQANIKVTVKSNPTVDAGPDKLLAYNSYFTIRPNYSSNARTYLWTPYDSLSCRNCPQPGLYALKGNTYQVTVVSDSGCVARDQVSIAIECKDANLLMPTAFTPNNDNRNDTYQPITRGIKSIKRFSIYNRLGQEVYRADNYIPGKNASGWDGYFKGQPQNTGAFMYIVEGVCEIGLPVIAKGSFVLIR